MGRIMIRDIIDIQLNNSPMCLISSPGAWKLEERGLEALRWVDLTRRPNAARFNSTGDGTQQSKHQPSFT